MPEGWDTRAVSCAEAICVQYGITVWGAENNIARLLLGEFMQVAKQAEIDALKRDVSTKQN